MIRAESGAAIAETAMMMPLVLLIVTGVFSLSTVLYQKLLLTQAVSSGARQLAVQRGSTDPCNQTANALTNAAPGLVPASLQLTIVINGTTVANQKTPANATCTSVGSTMKSGQIGTLTATYPCSIAVYGMSFGTCTLSETETEVIQ